MEVNLLIIIALLLVPVAIEVDKQITRARDVAWFNEFTDYIAKEVGLPVKYLRRN